MEKLTENQRKEIILAYKMDNSKENLQRICDTYGITRQYIYKLLKKDTTGALDNSILSNESEFTKRANEIIKLAFDRLEEKVRGGDEKATISQLATLIGILYDKSRLESNLSTENKAISINIKIEK